MIGLPLGLLSVFIVGPGVRATYGTGTNAATTSPASTHTPAISNVTRRRDAGVVRVAPGQRLRTVDPLALAAGEELVLPDRHCRFQLVDEEMAGGKRDVTVFGTDRRYHREIADRQIPDPVRNRQRDDRVASGDLFGDPAELCPGRWVRAIGQGRHAAAMVVVPDGTNEDGDSPGSRVSRQAADLIDRQRLSPQLGHSDDGHDAKLQATGYLSAGRRPRATIADGPAVPRTTVRSHAGGAGPA